MPDRCPTCDREGCPMIGRGYATNWEFVHANSDCAAHAVDWRARALTAEADATRWRKVAPLIERLADDVRRRELIARAEFDRRVSDTVTALLAATQEPTP